MIGLLLTLVIVGFIVGAIARLLVPGRDRIGFGGTVLLGIIGSFVGGFLGYVLFHHHQAQGAFQASGFVGSVIGGIIVLLIYRRVSGHSHASR